MSVCTKEVIALFNRLYDRIENEATAGRSDESAQEILAEIKEERAIDLNRLYRLL